MDKETIDKLDSIFNHQEKLQKESLDINFDLLNLNMSKKQQYINQMLLAIHEEAVEVMRETAYKNPLFVPYGWKKNQEFNNENFKKEIIDLLHFVVNLCLVSGMTSKELYEKYINKNKINVKRQEENY